MAEGGGQSTRSEEKLVSEIDDKVLLCPICMDRFTSPKILPCFHTFCEHCLTDWVQKNKGLLQCPTCKQSWPLPSAGVPKLDNNFFLNDLIEVITNSSVDSKQPKCEICDKEAKIWCKDCGQYFCADECIRAHKVVRSLKDHQLMTIEEYNKEINSPNFRVIQPRFCDIHPSSPLEFYCESCQVPTCLKCTVVEHAPPDHKFITMEKALEKYTPKLKTYLDSVVDKIGHMRQSIDKTKGILKDLEQNKTTSEKEINSATKKVQDEVEGERQRLLGDLQDSYKPKRALIDEKIESIEFKLGCTESVQSYLSNILRYGGPVDIMSAKKEIDRHNEEKAKEKEPKVKLTSAIAFEENVDRVPIHLGCLKCEVKPTKVSKLRTPGLDEKGKMRRGSRDDRDVSAAVSQSIYTQVVATVDLKGLHIPGNEPKTAIEGAARDTGLSQHYKGDGNTVFLQGSLEQVTQLNAKIYRLQKPGNKDNVQSNEAGDRSRAVSATAGTATTSQSPKVAGNTLRAPKVKSTDEEGRRTPPFQRYKSLPDGGGSAAKRAEAPRLPPSRSLGNLSDSGKRCYICLSDIRNPRELPCKHSFCKECVDKSEKTRGPRCPVCKKEYGLLTGFMPKGTMQDVVQKANLPGYPSCDTIVITYDFQAGTQGPEHPHPGKPYNATRRTAYLPDNAEGREVLRLLKIAFQRRLTFTIDTSRTTGLADSIVWNDIRHKTSKTGGAEGYGYPDPEYLTRTKDELAVQGVK